MLRYVQFVVVSAIATLAITSAAKADNCLTRFSCQIGGECQLPCMNSGPVSTPTEIHQPDASPPVKTGSSSQTDKPQVTQVKDGKISPPLQIPRKKTHIARRPPAPPKRPIALASARREIANFSTPAARLSEQADPRLPVFLSPRNRYVIAARPDTSADPVTPIEAPAATPVVRSPSSFGKLSARIVSRPTRADLAVPAPADRHVQMERFQRLGGGLDPKISIAGVSPAAAGLLDGPISTGGVDPSAPETDDKHKKIRNALDAMPGENKADLFSGSDSNDAPPQSHPLHPKIYDVSEGTRLDPLKNKNYDLNSAKDIPKMYLQNN